MDIKEFDEYGKKAIDFIVDFRTKIRERPVISLMEPGYLVKTLPENAPLKPEKFDVIFDDLEKVIMPGVTFWNHPQFHGYFPSGDALPNVIADAITTAIGSICFNWTSCPAATELETIVLDWLARAINLPEHFMADKSNFIGGGSFQASASESTLLATIAARARSITYLKKDNGQKDTHDSVYLPNLVVYASKEAHSSVQKACKMAVIQLRVLDTDERGVLHGDKVLEAIRKDQVAGLTPCMVVATLGTTGLTAFDDLKSIGEAIKEANAEVPIWLHVDGAYGGNSFICPEFRHLMNGLEMADSFMINPNKLMLAAFDLTCFWVRDTKVFTEALVIDPAYLKNSYQNDRQIDYRNYSIPLSRRFRSLKLWFLMRSYGIEGLQNYIRNLHKHASYFVSLVKNDPRFEVFEPMHLTLVAFRYKDSIHGTRKSANLNTKEFVDKLCKSQELYVVPHEFEDKLYVRFSVNYEHTTKEDIDKSWSIIQKMADKLAMRPKKLSRRPGAFSFFRSVSKEVYERQNSHPNLKDGATPICVVDTDDILSSLRKATLKNKGDFPTWDTNNHVGMEEEQQLHHLQ